MNKDLIVSRSVGGLICLMALTIAVPGDVDDRALLRHYLDRGADIITTYGYYGDQLPDETVDAIVEHAFREGREPADAHAAIEQLLTLLGDRHSSFVLPENRAAFVDRASAARPEGERLTSGIAYLKLPALATADANGETAHSYVDAAWSVINANLTACGWIIDLRGNHGGNVVPMLGAIAPLVDWGPEVGYTTRDGLVRWFEIYDDGVYFDDTRLQGFDEDIPTSASSHLAVLTNESTASAAEAVLVALLDNGATSFGSATRGVPTGNSTVFLSDGAVMILTVAVATSVTNETYETSLQPDHTIAMISFDGTDAPLTAAASSFGSCR